MTEEKPFLIYKSSAGSGKTYTLAKEYLKLALKTPYYFRYILAVTFMNKAAEEMKNRVLEYLKAISEGDHPLFEELKDHLGFSDHQLQERAGEVLRNILHNYSRFSITTIDTFFNQVIRSFTREIGLHGGYEIELDTDLVLTKVVDDVLEEVSEDKQLREWLIDFAKDRLIEGKSYEFRSEIAKLGSELFNEQYKAIEHELIEIQKDKQVVSELNKKLNQIIFGFKSTLKKKGSEALKLLTENNLNPQDFSGKSRSVAYQFVKWKNGDLKKPTDTAYKATEDVAKWVAKSAPNRQFLVNLVEGSLQSILAEGIAYYEEEQIGYNTAIELRRYLYTFGILNDLAKKIKKYRDENEVVLISDLPTFLKDIIGDSDTPFIYEKVGTRYRHFLIDEFQDTSGFQWDNFQPLVKNSLDSGQFNMVVGDVKQSIYRWRGGNSDLLLNQISQDVGEHFVNEQQLQSNFRSSKCIIDFNNKLFSDLPVIVKDHLANEMEKHVSEVNVVLEESLNKVIEGFNEATQTYSPNPKDGGYIELQFTKEERDSEVKWDDMALEWAIAQAERVQQAGVALKDIAFLVRWNKDSTKLVNAFLGHKDSDRANPNCRYDVISSESMYLGNAVVVNFLLSVFRYLKNNKEKIALAEIVNIYQRDILKNSETFDQVMNVRNLERHLPPEFTKYKHILVRFPLYELTEALIRIFKLNSITEEIAYLQAFQDAVLDYVKKEKSDLNSFLIWWQELGYKRTVQLSEDLDAMKILTIHKSKGLQYKVVIMPFCDWELDHDTGFHDNVLWSSNENVAPYNEFPALPMKYVSSLASSHFQQDYFVEKTRAHIDNLNLLYVAFTRAEGALLVHARDSKVESLRDVSALLLSHLIKADPANQDQKNFQIGELEFNASKQQAQDQELQLMNYPSEKWRNKMTIKKHSTDFLEGDDESRRASINEGIITHRILASIEYQEDLIPTLEKTYHQLEINKEELERIKSNIEALFENEQIAQWYDRSWEVRTEAVVLPGQADAKRLDRVVIKDNKAVVIDFKTGKPKEKDEKQVMEYMDLLKQMEYEEVEGYLVYLGEVRIVPITSSPALLLKEKGDLKSNDQ